MQICNYTTTYGKPNKKKIQTYNHWKFQTFKHIRTEKVSKLLDITFALKIVFHENLNEQKS